MMKNITLVNRRYTEGWRGGEKYFQYLGIKSLTPRFFRGRYNTYFNVASIITGLLSSVRVAAISFMRGELYFSLISINVPASTNW